MRLKKKNVIRIFVLMILTAILIGGALFVKEAILSNEARVIYGTRTKDLKKNPIAEETIKKAIDELKADTTSIKIRVPGRIINIVMKVKKETTLEDAKKLGAKAAEFFKENSSYYDIQIMIDKEGESKQFPIIGYKHHNINTKEYSIVWTKDRAES